MAGKVSIPLLAFYLIAWYGLNIQYNLYNKKILNIFPFPYTCGLAQLASGLLYIAPTWLLGIGGRKVPTGFSVPSISLLAIFHGSGHYATVISLGAGSVAFANVVKAAEPLCSVVMGIIISSSFPTLMECGTLLPIVAGVMIASMAEPEFSMNAFTFAMLSNVLFAARGALGKKVMSSNKMSGADTFAILTIFAMIFMAPVTMVMEGQDIKEAFDKLTTGTDPVDYAALAKGDLPKNPSPTYFLAYQVVCGIYYYLYNEMAFMVLDLLDPVGQAVGNTVKRVVVIIAGTIAFNKPLTQNGSPTPAIATTMSCHSMPLSHSTLAGMIGSAVAIGGVLLYSLAKSAGGAKKKTA